MPATAARSARPGPAVRSFWIGVASSDHVAIAVAGAFVQLSHGRAGPLERMRTGDGFLFYSPRSAYPEGDVVQAFTALGRVTGDAIFEADLGNGVRVFRRQAEFLPTREAPIRPLLESLTFVRSKTHWGAAFRFGFLRIPEQDFAGVAAAMGRDFATDFPGGAATSAVAPPHVVPQEICAST